MVFMPQINRKLAFLLNDKTRIKAVYGGRAGGKSYSLADAVLARMLSRKTIVTVCREYHTTIKDSVHRLFKERIGYHHIDHLFDVVDNQITCLQNGSILTYKHLHNNVTEVKGLQGTDLCYLFEAEALEEDSWVVLEPTIRKPGSEIWVEFNPRYEDDFSYRKFVVEGGKNIKAVQINYLENPMCPDEVVEMANECKRVDIMRYRHVWLGEPLGVGSRVYPSFDKNVHVKAFDMKELINRNAEFFMAMDPHTLYWPFCVWIARVPLGGHDYDYWVYNEFPMLSTLNNRYYNSVRKSEPCNLTLAERANIIKVLDNTISETYNVNVRARALDTRFAKAAGAPSETLNTKGIIVEMAEPHNGGLVFETPPEGTIDSQRETIRHLLHYNKQIPINTVNRPRLYVAPWCHNVIVSMAGHRDDMAKNREDEKYKDPIDAMRICFALMAAHRHEAGRYAEQRVERYEYVYEREPIATGWMA